MMQRLNESARQRRSRFGGRSREGHAQARERQGDRPDAPPGPNRRAATLGFGLATGRSLLAQERLAATLPGAKVCILTPEAVQGPFYFDPNLVRADITEARRGPPLALTLQVASVKDCARLKGARVDLWHADGQGMYSGYRGQGDD